MLRSLIALALALGPMALALPSPALAEDLTPRQERCLTWQAENGRPDRFARLPSFCLWHHAGYWCEPEQNPPEGWLRPNGFCALAALTAKASLIYTGADYWFGFKE